MDKESNFKKTPSSGRARLKNGLSDRINPLGPVKTGEVDALVISNDNCERLFSSQGLDFSCRVMIENMIEAAVVLDVNGIIVFTNRAFSILAGCQMSSLVGTPFTDFLPSSFHKSYATFISKCAVRPYRDEFAIAYVQGSTLPVSISGTLYEVNGNRNICLIINDLTERKAAEEMQRIAFDEVERKVVERTAELEEANKALRESEKRYRELFNSLIEGYCIIEMVFDADNKPVDYRFLEINEAFESQTGLHDAQGKLMRDLAPDHEQHWFDIYGKIALTGKAEHFTNEAKALNRWFDVQAFRLGGQESKKVVICFSDITERKKAEDETRRHAEELRRSNEELERFNRAMVGRELQMVELKKQVNELCAKLGEPQRFAADFND